MGVNRIRNEDAEYSLQNTRRLFPLSVYTDKKRENSGESMGDA